MNDAITSPSRTGNETDRLESMLTAMSGMCQQLTTLQKAVIEGNLNGIQLSDILVDQAKAIEVALQQYRVTVDASFREATQKTVSMIREELHHQLDEEAGLAVKNHVVPQMEYFLQQQEDRLAVLEAASQRTREWMEHQSQKKYGWKLFFASLLLVVLTGALSSVLVTTILMPRNIMRMDEIRLAALSAGSVLMEAWPRLTDQEKYDINQTLQKANRKSLSLSGQPAGQK